MRRAREGIDVNKLSKGEVKKKKKKPRDETETGGLRPGASTGMPDEDEDEEDADAKARRVVRSNNFTVQTNVLDVDKHMCVQPAHSDASLTDTITGWRTSRRT